MSIIMLLPGRHNGKQEAQLLLWWVDYTAYVRRPAFDFWSQKESEFPE